MGERAPVSIRGGRHVKVLFVDHHTRLSDDTIAVDKDVIGTLGVTGAAEEGAHPTAPAEARLVLMA